MILLKGTAKDNDQLVEDVKRFDAEEIENVFRKAGKVNVQLDDIEDWLEADTPDPRYEIENVVDTADNVSGSLAVDTSMDESEKEDERVDKALLMKPSWVRKKVDILNYIIHAAGDEFREFRECVK